MTRLFLGRSPSENCEFPWSSTCPSADLGPKYEECSSDPQTTQKNGEKVAYLSLVITVHLRPTAVKTVSEVQLYFHPNQRLPCPCREVMLSTTFHFSCIWCEEHSNVRSHKSLPCPRAERSPVHKLLTESILISHV